MYLNTFFPQRDPVGVSQYFNINLFQQCYGLTEMQILPIRYSVSVLFVHIVNIIYYMF